MMPDTPDAHSFVWLDRYRHSEPSSAFSIARQLKCTDTTLTAGTRTPLSEGHANSDIAMMHTPQRDRKETRNGHGPSINGCTRSFTSLRESDSTSLIEMGKE